MGSLKFLHTNLSDNAIIIHIILWRIIKEVSGKKYYHE